jgi:hypothetical protein
LAAPAIFVVPDAVFALKDCPFDAVNNDANRRVVSIRNRLILFCKYFIDTLTIIWNICL